MIDAKLEVLRSLGVVAQGTAPWIETKDLYAACRETVQEIQEERIKEALDTEDVDIYEEEPEMYPVDDSSWVVAFVRDRTYA